MKYCTVCKEKYEDNVSFCPRDGEVLEDDPTSLVDQTLDGQYHIESLLGKGGMGAVYRARHILLGDRVAIKVLPPEMRNNAEWLRRFRREGQAARRFRHPNAVTVYDLRTTSDGLIYMVMEYVEGHTLDAELRARGRFTPAEAFEVLEPVMSVLNAAHEMGVVHRDLKPENIMLGRNADGRHSVKLLDLGIAKMREVAGTSTTAATALTMAGQILGTPYYMSPEQWGEVPRDGNSEIDGRADIYSLGIVFYELIAARKPFLGESLADLRRGHVAVTPRPLHEFVSDVSQEFSRAVSRAMSKDRNDRQETAEELDKELRAALGLPQSDRAFSSSKNLSASFSPTDSASDAQKQSTRVVPEGRETRSDLSAPTVITSDSETTSDASVAPPARPVPQATIQSLADVGAASPSNAVSQSAQPAPSRDSSTGQKMAASTPTIATNPNAVASPAHVPNVNAQAAMPVAARRRSPVIPIIGVVLLLLLMVGGVGGFFIWRALSNPSTDETEKKANENANLKDGGGANLNVKGTGEETANMTETLRYWLEVKALKGDATTQGAGVLPLASGQSFRFHFKPNADGYVYIIGPGLKNVPTTFLTTKPVPQSGVKSNEVRSGVDYSFPTGDGNWLTLDKTTGTENYTIIFSETQIQSPAFLSAAARRQLSDAEQKELEDLRAAHQPAPPRTEVVSANSSQPFVSVKVPKTKGADQLIFFDVRVEHQ